MNAKNRKLILSAVSTALREAGATQGGRGLFPHEWSANTPHGAVNITLFLDPHPSRPWLAVRFDEPAKARAAGVDSNPHTGKYNCHPGKLYDHDPGPVIRTFLGHLQRAGVLPA